MGWGGGDNDGRNYYYWFTEYKQATFRDCMILYDSYCTILYDTVLLLVLVLVLLSLPLPLSAYQFSSLIP